MIRYQSTNLFAHTGTLICAVFLLTACDEIIPAKKANPNAETAPEAATNFKERDVEAPEVFSKTDKALWDGRPSLGGVWVAHPDNQKPERVIIRNKSNGKFVIGALFNREKSLPGPAFQLSSDAASAIGATAGTTLEISVTAMRIEKVAVEKPSAPKPAPSDDIASSTLETLEETKTPAKKIKKTKKPSKTTLTVPVEKPSTASPASGKYAQLGLFSVEANAKATLAKVHAKGLSGKIVSSTSKGKKFYRVLAGPAATKAEQAKILKTVKSLGFSDAYIVKG